MPLHAAFAFAARGVGRRELDRAESLDMPPMRPGSSFQRQRVAAFAGAALALGVAVGAQAADTRPGLDACWLQGIEHQAWCGSVRRPLDPARPQGRQIDIRYAVLPALARNRHADPVFFFEAIKLYRSVKEAVPEGHYTVPLGQARVVQSGEDVSVICYGGMVEVCRKAAEAAGAHGIGVEVLDLRTLVPLDTEAVLKSVRKTGRAVIVTEAPRTGGFHNEIAALIAEGALESLLAPPVRVTGFDAPYPPFTAIEDVYRPNPLRVAKAIRKVMAY